MEDENIADDLEAGIGEHWDDDDSEDYTTSKAFLAWNNTTARLGDLAALPLCLVQLPQIILSAFALLSADNSLLFEISWKLQLTSTIGNLSMLSYFTRKRERSGIWVQTCCMLMSIVVQVQMAMVGAMPFTAIEAIVAASIVGMYQQYLPNDMMRIWEETICLTASSSLMEVIVTSTFLKRFIHQSVHPMLATTITVMFLLLMARSGKLPSHTSSVISAWSGMILCSWTSVLQMNSTEGATLAVVMLTMLGNGLQLPRAIFTRDVLWFTSAVVGALFQGWGILLSMYISHSVTDTFFWGTTWALGIWLSKMLQKDARAYRLPSSLVPILELISCSPMDQDD